MCEFEQKVLDGLSRCGANDSLRIGVAVSGGADSVSLLLALSHIYKSVYVITVNHNIRAEKETCGDAQFVQELCEKLSSEKECKVVCCRKDIPRGEVERVAKERLQGVEEAARFLRYNLFEQFIREYKLDFLCLAHNKNDQLETLLMRFLQGSSTQGMGGILPVRGQFIRPLLDVERTQIEDYLRKENVSWRTDSTNLSTVYTRNKIRLELMPFLDEKWNGWRRAVLSAGERAKMDADVLERDVDGVDVSWEGDCAVIKKDVFDRLLPAIKYRLLLKCCSKAGENLRIPYGFLDDFCKNPRDVSFHNIQILIKNDTIFVKKLIKTHTESLFSDIIYKKGIYNFPFGILSVEDISEKTEKSPAIARFVFNDETIIEGIELPCCVRSFMTGDEIETSDGNLKKVVDIFSNWHVPLEQRNDIPIVQKLLGKEQPIIGIAGSVCGFDNWFVKGLLN